MELKISKYIIKGKGGDYTLKKLTQIQATGKELLQRIRELRRLAKTLFADINPG